MTEDADGKVWAGRYLPRDRTHGDPENPKNIAVIGGGITGLSTAHYLAKYASKGTTITLYEASDRLGGWLNTQHVGIEYNGAKSTVRFERGPRTLRSYAMDTWKMDDLVLYDLVSSIPRPQRGEPERLGTRAGLTDTFDDSSATSSSNPYSAPAARATSPSGRKSSP